MEPTQSQELSSTTEMASIIEIDVNLPRRMDPAPPDDSMRLSFPSEYLQLSWMGLFKLLEGQGQILYNFLKYKHCSYVVRDHRTRRSEWRLTEPIFRFKNSFKRNLKVYKASIALKRRNYRRSNTSNGLLMVSPLAMAVRSDAGSSATNSSESIYRIPGSVLAARLQAPIQALRGSGAAFQARQGQGMQAPIPANHAIQAPTQTVRAPFPDFRNNRAPIPDFQNIRAPIPDFQYNRAPIPDFQNYRAPMLDFQNNRAPFPAFQNYRAPNPAFQNNRAPNLDYQNYRDSMLENQAIRAQIPGFQNFQARIPANQAIGAQLPEFQTIRAPIPGFHTIRAPIPGFPTARAPISAYQSSIPTNQAIQAPTPDFQTIRALEIEAPVNAPKADPSSAVNRRAALLLRYIRESGGHLRFRLTPTVPKPTKE